MTSSLSLSKIRIFPIKSLDFVELDQVKIDVHTLYQDREFALITSDGRYVNGKRTGRVNQLQAQFDLENYKVDLGERGKEEIESFELREGNNHLNEYLCDFFQMDVQLIQKANGELQDMPKVGSVTLVSQASLMEIHKSFPELSLEDFRQRFRVNLEFEGGEAFEEEVLFASKKEENAVQFSIGNVEMFGISPRVRCGVPPRDPNTGEADKSFVKKMMDKRLESLPSHSLLTEYPNLYYLSINTFLDKNQKGKTLSLGDSIRLLGKKSISSLY